MNTPVVSGLRVTQERASVSQIEAACRHDPRTLIRTLLSHEEVTEAFVLQTCLRAEVYVVTGTPDTGNAVLSDVDFGVPNDVIASMNHEECLRHLLRIAAGLESFVIGEDQILGQVQAAIERADEVNGLGPVLDAALSKAVQIGKRARDETAINDGPTSIGGAAVKLVEREVGLNQKTALVIGTGEMGEHIAHALSLREETELYVANRTRKRAERLVGMLEGSTRVVSFNAIPTVLPDVDILVSATASRTAILDSEDFANSGRTLVVDIAQPRDIDPVINDRPRVDVYDLDAVESITEQAREDRREAAESVETMIEEALTELLKQYKRQRIERVIAGMYRGAERIKREELDTAFSKLEHHGGLTDDQKDDIEALADALVSELLAPPTEALREAATNDDWRTIVTAIHLFDPVTEYPKLKDAESTRHLASISSPKSVVVMDDQEDD